MTFKIEEPDFKERLHMPLVICWACGCTVRIVDDDGLCEVCQPNSEGKSAVKQKKEKEEPETPFTSEINTDEIAI